MANSKRTEGIGRPAASDLREKLLHFGKLVTGEKIDVAGAGEEGFILEEVANIGQHVTIAMIGIGKVKLGGNVAIMAPLKPDAAGKAVTAVAGNKYSAKALQAGVTGDIVEVLIERGTLPA